MEYNRNFSFYDAYDFLSQNGLSQESDEIKNSSDKFKSYTSTLKRAKIIVLVRGKKLLDEFCKSVWQSGLTDKGKSRIRFFENLVERFNAESVEDENEEEIAAEENEFAYENDLRNYLVRNLSVIEKGLKIYEAQDKTTGEEFFVPGTSRRIDILANDKDGNFVVIELKVSRGYEKVVGQTLYYQSMTKTHFNQQKVRAIIIGREITPELKAATQFLPDFELFEYQLSLTLNRIK
ncbi:MAG: endonuclease NucS [Phycisphaerae bacterium]|nr:endonuclease NucS [Phycisphaerae bacterium]MDD5381469.1 endonuclease NucS [Phycisphaerae bacterium]